MHKDLIMTLPMEPELAKEAGRLQQQAANEPTPRNTAQASGLAEALYRFGLPAPAPVPALEADVVSGMLPMMSHDCASTEEQARFLLGGCTTMMLCCVPDRLTPAMLVQELHSVGLGLLYDFLHIPLDKRKAGINRGIAFINFVSCEAALYFYRFFHGHRLPYPSSDRCLLVKVARVQGLESNLACRKIPQRHGVCAFCGYPFGGNARGRSATSCVQCEMVFAKQKPADMAATTSCVPQSRPGRN